MSTKVDHPLSLRAKLASIVVHVEEALSPGGHPFDRVALRSLLDDAEVQEYLSAARSLGLCPVKRRREQ